MSSGDALRVDVLLHRLCVTRSRSEAKTACDAGAVDVNGAPARASREVVAGDHVTIRFPRRTLEMEILTLPPKSTSRKAAREMIRTVRDEPRPEVV